MNPASLWRPRRQCIGMNAYDAAMAHRAGESFMTQRLRIDIWRYSWLIRGRNTCVSMSD